MVQLDRSERLALALHVVTVAGLTGDDVRQLSHLVDAMADVDREIETARTAAFVRFLPHLQDFVRTGSRADWADTLDAETREQVTDDAELTFGIRIEPAAGSTDGGADR